MRELRAVPADPSTLLPLLRDALSGDGPALLPVALGAPMPADLPLEVPKRIAVVVETSGSSGAPKRVMLSADALLASAAMTEAALGGPGRWLLALPVHYIAGIQVLVRSIVAGTDPILLAPGFAAAELSEAADGFGREPRYSALVPAQLASLIAAAAEDARVRAAAAAFDAVLVGGQRLPDSVADSAERSGIRVVRTYGSSETAGGCVYNGDPLGGTAVRIVDGEVWLSTPSLAEGYLGDEERTNSVFVSSEGLRWYRTGDDGSFEEGRLRVTGRRDDVVISGGEKVSLGAVEDIVKELPGLSDAVVVAGEDERWGAVPVVATASATADLESIRTAVRARLGRAAGPGRLLRLDPLPTLASGKPDRVEIARRAGAAEAQTTPPVVHVTALLVGDPAGRTLLVRKAGSAVFMQPGGKPEPGETAAEAGVRELHEELGIAVTVEDLVAHGSFRAAAANEAGHEVVADVFSLVIDPVEPKPRAEIAEAIWVDPTSDSLPPLAPLTRIHLLPLLRSRRDDASDIAE